MANILMLYAEQDSPLVEELKSALEKYGHNFLDVGLLPAVDMTSARAVPFYISASDVSVVVFTSASMAMPRFVSETAYMMGYLKDRGERDKVIPLVLDDGTRLEEPFERLSPIILDPVNVSETTVEIDTRINQVLGVLAAQTETVQQQRAQVKKSAATYIQSTQNELKEREKTLKQWAQTWYLISYVSLGAGVGLGIWRGVDFLLPQNGFGLAAYLFTGLIAATFLIAISKLSFTLAKGYMVESVRIADRSHAIAFGEFYLNAFEEKIEWSEVKEVFQHWNIDRGSSFISQEAAQFDPKLLETALEIAKVLKAQEKP